MSDKKETNDKLKTALAETTPSKEPLNYAGHSPDVLEARRKNQKPLEFIKEANGNTVIIFKKTRVHGKCSPGELLDNILIASNMQVEKYMEKLSRGAPLDSSEVKALSLLAEVAKTANSDTVVLAEANKQQEIAPGVPNVNSADIREAIFRQLTTGKKESEDVETAEAERKVTKDT